MLRDGWDFVNGWSSDDLRLLIADLKGECTEEYGGAKDAAEMRTTVACLEEDLAEREKRDQWLKSLNW